MEEIREIIILRVPRSFIHTQHENFRKAINDDDESEKQV